VVELAELEGIHADGFGHLVLVDSMAKNAWVARSRGSAADGQIGVVDLAEKWKFSQR
jgi:hypothetical protein